MTSILSGKTKYILAILVVLGAIAAWYGYNLFLKPNTNFEEKSKVIKIRESISLTEWLAGSDVSFIENTTSFAQASSLKKFTKLKPGRYRIPQNINNNGLINMLRSGAQEAINLRIDDVHDMQSLAGKLGKNTMYDSARYAFAFENDSTCQSYGFNTYTIACLIAPNTYDFFWTMTPTDFLNRMKKIYDGYWSAENIKKASSKNLTPEETIILASIVKAETAKKEEAPKIAGLYLNRLQIGMALQSDPTAVFGRQEHVQRVTLSDLRNDSPYNTYLHTGLPPGPIDFAESIYIDAVLNASRHEFIFMCAQPGGTGYHNFSRTLDQHNMYRNEYTRWLESKGIH